jgi:anthranilate phosphoribosyltransferase
MLSDIAHIIRKVAYRQPLNADEVHQCLNRIGEEDPITDSANSDGMYFLALSFGLMAKGLTADELYGFVMSIAENSASLTLNVEPANVTDLSGTGGDTTKTFNVGTTASFVVAAADVRVVKQATRAYTGISGSADIFKELGIDVFTFTDTTQINRYLDEVGIVALYTPALSAHFNNRVDFFTKLRTIGLTFPTPWHLVSWVYSPVKMTSRVYGVFDERYLRSLAEVFLRLGYQRGMTVNGIDGLDEVSNIGPTRVCEFESGTIKEYLITPEELGVRRATAEEILSHSRDESIGDFLRILFRAETGAKRDIVLLNAGASLYMNGRSETWRAGVELARGIIETGAAAEKVERFCALSQSTDRLAHWKKRLSI